MAKAPNLLYIQYDQQRYDCVSMSRRFGVKTPNLERIAGTGAFFENCYTPIPVCAGAGAFFRNETGELRRTMEPAYRLPGLRNGQNDVQLDPRGPGYGL